MKFFPVMKKLHRLIISSYIGPFIVTFFISVFILLMQFLWKWMEDLIGKGLEWTVIAEILFYASSNVVPMALPLAVLLSSVMTFGNLGEHYELPAMKSAGISLFKIMMPVIIFNLLISVSAFFFSNYALPYTNLKFARILYDVSSKRPELNIKTGVFNNDIQGYSIKIGSKKDKMMYDFMIYDHTKNKGNREVTLADSGKINVTADQKNMVIMLYNGSSYNELKDNSKKRKEFPYRHDKFSEEKIILPMTGFELKKSSESLWKNNYNMMNLKQLTKAIDSLQNMYNNRKKIVKKRFKNLTYLKEERKISRKAKAIFLKDSLYKYRPPDSLYCSLNLDTVYAAMNTKQKRRVVSLAKKRANSVDRDIARADKNIKDRLKWLRKHQLAWYRKFSLSFACLIFFFIGAPLGSIIRKGGFGVPFLISTILFMFYYVITITGEKFVKEDVLPVVVGSWLSSAILFPLGVFITYKASKDATLLDTTRIKVIINKIKKILKIKNVE